jgi:hypothetical protein
MPKKKKMPKMYAAADSVEEVAAKLIPTYHPELASAEISYVFVSEASLKDGRPVLGKAKKLSGALGFLVGKNFFMEVALNEWNAASERQRHALVDHLLECCTGIEDEETGDMRWVMREPDVREFTSIIHRHGAWNETLSGMIEVAQRLNIEEKIQETLDVSTSETRER